MVYYGPTPGLSPRDVCAPPETRLYAGQQVDAYIDAEAETQAVETDVTNDG